MAEEMANATATAENTAPDTQAGNNAGDNAGKDTAQQQNNTNPAITEAMERIIQSKVDKATADISKKYALAQKEVEQLKKDKMTADELAKYEIDQEKKALAAERAELLDKSNRLLGINELTKLELYDGSETANSLLNMVVNGAKEESEIVENVKAMKSVVDKLVAAQVSKTFKENGRVPNGGDKGGKGESENKNNIAAELGKKAAERAKSSNDILNFYYGGKK